MFLWRREGPTTACTVPGDQEKQKQCDDYIEGKCRDDCVNLRKHCDWFQCISEKKGKV